MWRSEFFQTTRIDCMVARIYVSKKSVQYKCVFFSKSEGKNFALFRIMFNAQKRPLQIKSAFETYINCQRFTSRAETEKKLALDRTQVSHNVASNITNSAIAFQDSSWLTTTFSAHCTVHCAVEDFNVIFAIITPQSRFDTVPRTVLSVGHHAQCYLQDIMCRSTKSWNCVWGRSAVHILVGAYHELSTKPRSSLSSENNDIPQTGVKLAYSINSFGSSAGRVSIIHFCT